MPRQILDGKEKQEVPMSVESEQMKKLFVGIDIGSTTTKIVAMAPERKKEPLNKNTGISLFIRLHPH